MRIKRYNKGKAGSFQISLEFFDWELSIVIGALRAQRKEAEANGMSRAYITFLKKLENKFSNALSALLKVELKDIKIFESARLTEVLNEA